MTPTPNRSLKIHSFTIAAMGLCSFLCFGIILGPLAVIQARRAFKLVDDGLATIDALQRGQLQCGMLLGILGTMVWTFGIIALLIAAIISHH